MLNDSDKGKGKEKLQLYRELDPEERRPLMTSAPQARASCWQVFQRQPTDIFIFVVLGSALGATISILTNNKVFSLFELEEISAVSVAAMSIVTAFLLFAYLALQDKPFAHHLSEGTNAGEKTPEMLALRWVIVLFLAVQFVISISLLLFIPRDCQGCLLGKWHFTAYTIINGFLPLGILWSFVHPKQCQEASWWLGLVGSVRIVLAVGVSVVLDDTDDNAELFLGILDGINFFTSILALCVLVPFARTVAATIPDMDGRLRFRTAVVGLAIRHFWLLAMLIIINLSWSLEIFYEFLHDHVPILFQQSRVHRSGNSPPVELFAEWINASWVWVIDTFPALVIALPMFLDSERVKPLWAVLKCANGFALGFLYSAYVVDLIAVAAKDALSPEGFWLAKIGAKYLIGLVLYQWYIGFRSVRTIAMRFGLSHVLMVPELQPAHTHLVPMLLVVFIFLHVVGWIAMLVNSWFPLASFAIFTGVLVIVIWTLVIFSYYHAEFGPWVGNKFPHWRTAHHYAISLSMFILLFHGVIGFSGQPFFWVAVIFTLILGIVDWFFCAFRDAELQNDATDGTIAPKESDKLCLLKLKVDVRGGWFSRHRSYHAGQTVLLSYQRKLTSTDSKRPSDAPKVHVREYSVMWVDHIDDQGRRTHSILSILVDVEAGKGGKSHLLRDPTQFSFKVTAGFWGEYYPATHDPNPVCIVGLGSGIGALHGVAVERIKNDLPTCAVFVTSELAIWDKVNEIVSTPDNSYVEEGFQPGEDSTKPAHLRSEEGQRNRIRTYKFDGQHSEVHSSRAGRRTPVVRLLVTYRKELPTALKRTGKTKVYVCGNLNDADLTKENFEVIREFNPATKKRKEDACSGTTTTTTTTTTSSGTTSSGGGLTAAAPTLNGELTHEEDDEQQPLVRNQSKRNAVEYEDEVHGEAQEEEGNCDVVRYT